VYEVELKFRVIDPAAVEGRLTALGARFSEPIARVDRWTELLEALGFCRVLEVAKRRRPGRVARDGADIEIALDSVTGLGDFLELELIATPEQVSSAQACLESLAHAIGCGAPEPRSYLELLLERI